MANPPITIGPFANVPAPGSPIRSDWAQQITQYVVDRISFGVPRGTMGYAQIVANSAAINAITDVGGLFVNWTAVTGRRYRTTVWANWHGSVAGDLLFGYITDGAGVAKQHDRRSVPTGGYGVLAMSLVETGLVGAIQRKVQHAVNSGAGTSQIVAAVNMPAYILVEDIGT